MIKIYLSFFNIKIIFYESIVNLVLQTKVNL